MTPGRAGVLTAALGACLWGGCFGGPDPALIEREKPERAALRPGETSREEVLFRYGAPTAVFENGRILTFRLTLTPEGAIPVDRELDRDHPGWTAWRQANRSLVTVFGQDGLLLRFSLVRIH